MTCSLHLTQHLVVIFHSLHSIFHLDIILPIGKTLQTQTSSTQLQ